MSQSLAQSAEANYKTWNVVNTILVVVSALAFGGLFGETLVSPSTQGFTGTDATLLVSFMVSITGVLYSGSRSDYWADQSRQLGF